MTPSRTRVDSRVPEGSCAVPFVQRLVFRLLLISRRYCCWWRTVAGLVVAGMIGRVGWTLGREAMEDLLDEVPAQEVLDIIAAIIHSVPDVRDYKALRVRRAGPFLHVDVQVCITW